MQVVTGIETVAGGLVKKVRAGAFPYPYREEPEDRPLWRQGAGSGAGLAPAAHAASHQNGGTDEISVVGLSGLLADGQTPVNHDHSGDAGDGGTFDAANLTSGAATDGQVLTADGAGGSAWEAPTSTLDIAGLTDSTGLADIADSFPFYDLSAAANRRIFLSELAGISMVGQTGRLSLTQGNPTATADVTGATVLYYTPFTGSRLCLVHDAGSLNIHRQYFDYKEFAFGAPTLTSGKLYDVYCRWFATAPSSTDTTADTVTFASSHFLNTGAYCRVAETVGGLTAGTDYWLNATSGTAVSFHTTLANALAGTSKVNLTANVTQTVYACSLVLDAAWTNDTARAGNTPGYDGGILSATSGSWSMAAWLGTIRASGANTMEDSGLSTYPGKRFVWNVYNQVRKEFCNFEVVDSWNYTTATLRQMRANAANQVECVNGMAGMSLLDLTVRAAGGQTNTAPTIIRAGIGEDSTSALATECFPDFGYASDVIAAKMSAILKKRPALGYHYYTALEWSTATGTTTWYGDAGVPTLYRSGMTGWWEC